jgi:hypothetical protein
MFVSSKGSFSDDANAVGIGAATRPYLTFGLFFFDYDLDGRLDFLQTNGHVDYEIAQTTAGQAFEQPAQLFWNAGPQAGADYLQATAAEAGPDLFRPLAGRGAAYGDLDGDGDLDVVLTGIGVRPRVLQNDQQLDHHWVRVKLVGRRTNKDAIGARLELKAGGVWQRQTVSPTKSYLSQCERTLTFGLGKATTVEEARVIWPAGRVQAIERLSVDQTTVVEEQ